MRHLKCSSDYLSEKGILVSMMIIKCAHCKGKLFKYIKIGRGAVWHCWKDRIVEDYTIKQGTSIHCSCGALIGTDKGSYIQMHQAAFITVGH